MGLEISAREIIEHFTPKQLQAYEATYTHRYILYGGARGGGKSRLLRWWLLLFLLEQYAKYGNDKVTVGLFCETYRDLQDRQIGKIKLEFPAAIGEIRSTQDRGLGFYLHDSLGGGQIALRNLDDPSKYQSAEFAAIAVDELTKITKEKFDLLRGSLRYPGVARTVFMGATNPGGVGHLWVKQLWIDRIFPPEMESISHEFKFIQSLPTDNSHLDKQYWDDLNSLPPNLRRAWVEGDWNVFAGQAFTQWREDIHVVKPFEVPDHWVKWRAIDWGYNAPFCCLWMTRDPDTRRVYVYRELYMAGLTEDKQVQMIADMTPPSERISLTYADPAMWTRKTASGTVTSTADEYARNGIVLTRADNDRINGKRKVDKMLGMGADGLPRLQVFSTCVNLIRTLPSLPYSDVNIEDVDTEAEDHAYDALRYGLTGEPRIMRTTIGVNPWIQIGE